MMNDILTYFTFRTVIVFISTAFSLLVVMLLTNIITIHEVSVILNLSPEATNALEMVVSRVKEVTGNILDIISQLLEKLFGWAGVEVDLNKISVDTNGSSDMPTAPQPGSSTAAPGK